jgi:hypothetical protein
VDGEKLVIAVEKDFEGCMRLDEDMEGRGK